MIVPDKKLEQALQNGGYSIKRATEILAALKVDQSQNIGLKTMIGQLAGDKPSQRYRLIVLRQEEPRFEEIVDLEIGEFLVGRQHLKPIHIENDPCLSRTHGKFTLHEDGRLTYVHLSRKNPTWLMQPDREPLRIVGAQHEMQPGEWVVLGTTYFMFVVT